MEESTGSGRRGVSLSAGAASVGKKCLFLGFENKNSYSLGFFYYYFRRVYSAFETTDPRIFGGRSNPPSRSPLRPPQDPVCVSATAFRRFRATIKLIELPFSPARSFTSWTTALSRRRVRVLSSRSPPPSRTRSTRALRSHGTCDTCRGFLIISLCRKSSNDDVDDVRILFYMLIRNTPCT